MGKKLKTAKLQHTIPNQQKKKPTENITKQPLTNTAGNSSNLERLALPFVLVLTFIAYLPALQAGFVNWDDDGYVLMNPLVKDITNLKAIFTTPVEGNYHPLTMLSLALNYTISAFEPWSYHLLNVLLHLANCILVFRLASLLSNRNIIIALTTALLFGIHPLHVESVAWVSERKDVLYSLFFLAGLISYTRYADTNSRKQYLLAILFLALSLLSKPAAVIFPVVLFCIDLLRTRKLSPMLFVEKVPFFVLALSMGIITFMVQKDAGAVVSDYYDIGTRTLFASYGIMMYFLKMIAPLNLSPFYPFPLTNETLSQEYYIAPLFVIALAALFLYSLKRNKAIAFGISFYVVNLLLVLQFLSIGSAIIAERYTYIPLIGLFFAIGWLIDKYSRSSLARASYFILPVALMLTFITYGQASAWIQSSSLWDHAIETQPSARAYQLRATLYRKDKEYNKALEYFNEAIKLNPYDYEAYSNRGMTYMDLNELDLAYQDFSTSIAYKPDFYTSLDNMGVVQAMKGNYDSSLHYLNRSIAANAEYYSAYRNRGLTYIRLNMFTEAVSDLRKYLSFEPGAFATYNTLGICYQNLGKYQEAIAAITKAISLKPDPVFYLNRSYSYNAMKNVEAARSDALFAKQNGIAVPDEYARLLGI